MIAQFTDQILGLRMSLELQVPRGGAWGVGSEAEVGPCRLPRVAVRDQTKTRSRYTCINNMPAVNYYGWYGREITHIVLVATVSDASARLEYHRLHIFHTSTTS
jgi:hypothetical protein